MKMLFELLSADIINPKAIKVENTRILILYAIMFAPLQRNYTCKNIYI